MDVGQAGQLHALLGMVLAERATPLGRYDPDRFRF
jgi:hypothetical protein